MRDVPGLGSEGALKAVPVGYWRNFLQPQGLASFADEGVLRQLKRQRDEEERLRMEEKAKAQAMVRACIYWHVCMCTFFVVCWGMRSPGRVSCVGGRGALAGSAGSCVQPTLAVCGLRSLAFCLLLGGGCAGHRPGHHRQVCAEEEGRREGSDLWQRHCAGSRGGHPHAGGWRRAAGSGGGPTPVLAQHQLEVSLAVVVVGRGVWV